MSARFGRRAVLAGAVAFAAGGFYWQARVSNYDGAALSVAEAHAKAGAGEITLVDIRRPDEWARTGVGEGAHPIDMRRDDFAQALDMVTGGDRDAPVALICAAGVRSARLANRLRDAGYTQIINVPEGMEGSSAGPGWVAARLPLSGAGAAD